MSLTVKDATKVTQTLKSSLDGTEHVVHHNIDSLPALTAGSNLIGKINLSPATSGGYTTYRNIDLDETGVNVKASAGQVFGWYVFNNATTTRFLKLYNVASAPTVGTTTPLLTIPIPSGAAANVEFGAGIAFGTGIGVGCTTGVADNDTGAPGANDCVVNLFYS
jgi:hypothetical protein